MQASIFDAESVPRNGVLFESRLAFTGDAMEFLMVPGADDVVPVELSLQWASHMIADARDHAEFSASAGNRDSRAAQIDFRQRSFGKFF